MRWNTGGMAGTRGKGVAEGGREQLGWSRERGAGLGRRALEKAGKNRGNIPGKDWSSRGSIPGKGWEEEREHSRKRLGRAGGTFQEKVAKSGISAFLWAEGAPGCIYINDLISYKYFYMCKYTNFYVNLYMWGFLFWYIYQ